MKNRRKIVIAFLLIASLTLGIGYALISDVLDIQGTAEISGAAAEEELNQDVFFSAVSQAANGEYTAQINSQNNDKASFTVNSLTDIGQTVSITFTIKNEGTAQLDAVVTPQLIQNSSSDYFEVTSDWQGNSKVVEAGTTETYTVTVKLLKIPTDTVSSSINIELKASSDSTATTATTVAP
ncbi:MAG: hypothetical protein IJV72_07545 [Clostridia bacterium]|nr:hypothetical protein [Clostridia bacterium]